MVKVKVCKTGKFYELPDTIKWIPVCDTDVRNAKLLAAAPIGEEILLYLYGGDQENKPIFVKVVVYE